MSQEAKKPRIAPVAARCPIPGCGLVRADLKLHLKTIHKLANPREILYFLKLARGRINISKAPCPVARCRHTAGKKLKRHIEGVHGKEDGDPRAQMRRVKYLKHVAQWTEFKRQLAELRASDPDVPVVSTIDLDDYMPVEAPEPESEDEARPPIGGQRRSPSPREQAPSPSPRGQQSSPSPRGKVPSPRDQTSTSGAAYGSCTKLRRQLREVWRQLREVRTELAETRADLQVAEDGKQKYKQCLRMALARNSPPRRPARREEDSSAEDTPAYLGKGKGKAPKRKRRTEEVEHPPAASSRRKQPTTAQPSPAVQPRRGGGSGGAQHNSSDWCAVSCLKVKRFWSVKQEPENHLEINSLPQPTRDEQLLSTHFSESDVTEDRDDW